jgi:hypothetical protein
MFAEKVPGKHRGDGSQLQTSLVEQYKLIECDQGPAIAGPDELLSVRARTNPSN